MSRFGSVEPLGPQHDVAAFDCGSEPQTTWLRRHALQAHRSGTARVYVVCRRDTPVVVGYYALASGSVSPADAPDRVTKDAGRYRVPVVLLTRLGVDRGEQAQGLGHALVRDALFQVLLIAELVGVRALLIHAETAQAAAFCRSIDPGFTASPTDPLHLILLLKDLRAALRVGLRTRFGGALPDEAMEIRDSGVDIARVLAAVRAAREDG